MNNFVPGCIFIFFVFIMLAVVSVTMKKNKSDKQRSNLNLHYLYAFCNNILEKSICALLSALCFIFRYLKRFFLSSYVKWLEKNCLRSIWVNQLLLTTFPTQVVITVKSCCFFSEPLQEPIQTILLCVIYIYIEFKILKENQKIEISIK